MKQQRYSKQRETIKEFLASRTDHPTADVIYENVKKVCPNISLGTVYRNLNLIVETKDAIKIASSDGSDHFDARTTPHYHFVCISCGCVKDFPMEPISNFEQTVKKYTDDTIVDYELTFKGICKQCREKTS